jgi:hypothetical protein
MNGVCVNVTTVIGLWQLVYMIGMFVSLHLPSASYLLPRVSLMILILKQSYSCPMLFLMETSKGVFSQYIAIKDYLC